MGDDEPDTDFATELKAFFWLWKSKLLLGIIVGIVVGMFLSPGLDRAITRILNHFLPVENELPLEQMAEQLPPIILQGQRLEVLNQLVQDRHIFDGESDCSYTLEVVQALNRVPLLFAGEADVMNSYSIFTQDPGRSPVAFASMLTSMAETLGIEAPILARKGITFAGCE